MSEWLRPILGAALLLAGAAGLAYKVISGYQHASPDAFFSVQDQNKSRAASAADQPTSPAAVPVDAAAPALSAATASIAGTAASAATAANATQSAPIAAAPTAPITTAAATAPNTAAAPPAGSGNTAAIASSAASKAALPADALDDPACVSIKAEQGEIQGALKKQYSPEQGRFMQRRLRELAEQSVKFKCSE